MNKPELPKCTLTDEQLIIEAELLIIPTSVNNDTKMIFNGLIARFAESVETKKKLLKVVEEVNLLLDKFEHRNN